MVIYNMPYKAIYTERFQIRLTPEIDELVAGDAFDQDSPKSKVVFRILKKYYQKTKKYVELPGIDQKRKSGGKVGRPPGRIFSRRWELRVTPEIYQRITEHAPHVSTAQIEQNINQVVFRILLQHYRRERRHK